MSKPSVGRIVHYVGAHSGQCRAAIITEVEHDSVVGLNVMYPSGQFVRQHVIFDHTACHMTDTWHWPEVDDE